MEIETEEIKFVMKETTIEIETIEDMNYDFLKGFKFEINGRDILLNIIFLNKRVETKFKKFLRGL